MNDDAGNQLTPQGQVRREVMLGELVELMARTRRARKVRRKVGAAVACVGLLLVASRWAIPLWSNRGEVAPRIVEHSSERRAPSMVTRISNTVPTVTLRVHTDSSVVERYRATPVDRVIRMDDSALLATLVSIHRPAGLIRFGDRIALSAPVTDEELAKARRPD